MDKHQNFQDKLTGYFHQKSYHLLNILGDVGVTIFFTIYRSVSTLPSMDKHQNFQDKLTGYFHQKSYHLLNILGDVGVTNSVLLTPHECSLTLSDFLPVPVDPQESSLHAFTQLVTAPLPSGVVPSILKYKPLTLRSFPTTFQYLTFRFYLKSLKE